MLAHHCVVDSAATEQAAVDLRVQRLDAAVHDLGKPGDRGYVGDFDAVFAQQRGRAAGGEDRDAAIAQGAREVEQAFLVGDAEQGSPDVCAQARYPVGSAGQAERP